MDGRIDGGFVGQIGPGPEKSGKCAVKNVIYMIGDGMDCRKCR